MDRLACVDLPAFPLQLLERSHPDWRGAPAVVVDRDHPQGIVLWANEPARRSRILPGHRYAAALSLCGRLRAGVVESGAIEEAVEGIAEQLLSFSPVVEPSDEEPGVFWLDASGLQPLYSSLHAWAEQLHRQLQGDGWQVSVAVGFSRFGVYVLSRLRAGVVTFCADPASERRAVRRAPLRRLGLSPSLREALNDLGVRTVGELADLPPGGIRRRFDRDAGHLYRMARGDLHAPLRGVRPERPPSTKILFDLPEAQIPRLLFRIERRVPPLLHELAERGQLLKALRLELLLDRARPMQARIAPATPTDDEQVIVELVQLRLERTALGGGVIELEMVAEGAVVEREQLRLFAERPRRDLAAAERAIARLRAEYGDDVVGRFELRDAHLPEARFAPVPLTDLSLPRPSERRGPCLIREIRARSLPLPPRSRHERNDGWIIRDREHGPVIRLDGPYLISGGWWVREVIREYYFAHTQRGDILWVYYDRRRRRWYQQGEVR